MVAYEIFCSDSTSTWIRPSLEILVSNDKLEGSLLDIDLKWMLLGDSLEKITYSKSECRRTFCTGRAQVNSCHECLRCPTGTKQCLEPSWKQSSGFIACSYCLCETCESSQTWRSVIHQFDNGD